VAALSLTDPQQKDHELLKSFILTALKDVQDSLTIQ